MPFQARRVEVSTPRHQVRPNGRQDKPNFGELIAGGESPLFLRTVIDLVNELAVPPKRSADGGFHQQHRVLFLSCLKTLTTSLSLRAVCKTHRLGASRLTIVTCDLPSL